MDVFSQAKRIYLLILIATTLGSVGCGLPPTRTEFIEKLAKDNREIARSTRAFRSAILPLKDKNPAGSVRSAYQEMDRTLQEVRADVDGQLLPPSSTSAKDLLAAYKAYLDGQQDIMTNIMKLIVDEAEHPTEGNGWPKIDALLQKVNAKEGETWGKLNSAQSAYAAEHNYQVQNLADYASSLKAGK